MMNPFKRIKQLEKANSILSGEIVRYEALLKSYISAETVIAGLMQRGLNWYDSKELDYSNQVSYWNEAQALLKNEVFINEYNHFMAEMIKEIAKEVDVETIKYARFGPLAMEGFKNHIESISNPKREESFDEITEGI